MAREGSILKKVLATVLTLGTIAGGFFVAKNVLFNNGPVDPPPVTENVLATPGHLSFDDTNYILTWDIVENADKYKVDVNGSITTVHENEYQYTPTQETTTFKVQALDSTGEYLTSKWSDTISYTITIEDNKVSEAQVNKFVNDLDQYAELQKVVSMHLKDGDMYVQAVYEDCGDMVLKTKCVEYATSITSLKDAITTEHKRVTTGDSYTISNYKSMERLLKSDSFAGQMEVLNQEGYEFSIVTSQTVENSNGTTNDDSMIFAVIRAEKDGDVRYFQTRIECYVISPSLNQKTNYELKLETPSERKVYVKSFNELTGDMYDYYNAKYNREHTTTGA